jgi:hypothetical protein
MNDRTIRGTCTAISMAKLNTYHSILCAHTFMQDIFLSAKYLVRYDRKCV